jgi:hypothetical protein
MSEPTYDAVKVPARYHPLLRRLQRGTWDRYELEWLLRAHRELPPLIAAVVRQKLAQLGEA